MTTVKNNQIYVTSQGAQGVGVPSGGLTGQLLIKNSNDSFDTGWAMQRILASETYNPPSLASGLGVTTTLSVAGAALGDFVLASFSLDLQGITLTAYISSANTASIRLQNNTGSTIDIDSGILSVMILKI